MIRGVLRGEESELPGWVLILQAAEAWSMPPWEIEAQASQLWWERWRCWTEEKNLVRKGSSGD